MASADLFCEEKGWVASDAGAKYANGEEALSTPDD